MALVLVLAACSGAGGGNTAAGTSLRYGYDFSAQFTNTFDPAKSNGNCDDIVLTRIYDTLVHLDADNQLQPGLATSWVVSPDVKALTLTLRPGVQFQDGEVLDSAAVKQGLLHNKPNPQLLDLHSIDTIDTPDAATVHVNLKDQTAVRLLYGLYGREGEIVAPKAIKTAGKHPVGAGPFSFESYDPGSNVSLKAYDGYWDKGAYQLKGLQFVQVGTGPPAVTALEAHNVDLIRFEAESLDRLSHTAGIGVSKTSSGAYLQFEMRLSPTSPFSDLKVRQAMEYAINRDEDNKIALAGQGEVASQGFPMGSPVYDPALANTYSYNTDTAKQLLSQSSKPNGFEFTMIIPGGNIANMERQAKVIVDDLAKIGVTAHVKRIPASDIATGYYISRQGDAFAAAELSDPLSANKLYDNFGKFQFVAIYNDAERQDLTDISKQAFATSDINQAKVFVKQGEKIVVDQALEVPIAFMPQFIAYDKARVGGDPKAANDICTPPDLRNTSIKGKAK